MQRFSEKAPSEAIILTFSFALGLAAGETLAGTPTLTAKNIWGTDSVCAGLLLGTPAFDTTTTQVLVPVTGGIDWNDYALSVECATSNPEKTLSWSGILPVRLYPSALAGTC